MILYKAVALGVAISYGWVITLHEACQFPLLSTHPTSSTFSNSHSAFAGNPCGIALTDEGGTVPFIARYRKEATGNLDEVQIREIVEKVDYVRELLLRREPILASIAEQNKLADDLKARILATMDRSELPAA